MRLLQLLTLVYLVVMTAGCGSGGGSSIPYIINTAPTLADYTGSVNENAAAGSAVGNITIVSNGGSEVTSITLSGNGASDFSVSADGTISLADGVTLNYQNRGTYNLQAQATNSAGFVSEPSVVYISVHVTAALNIPLLIIAISFDDYPIKDSEENWHDKIFGVSNHQVNHYFQEMSHGKFALIPANETSGTVNDGVIKVSLRINHPGDAGMNNIDLADAINIADTFIDFSVYDTNANSNIEKNELQIMYIVGGGETSYGDSPLSSIWAYSWGMSSAFPDSQSPPILDGVKLMDFFADGTYSRFGEKHDDHFATIGIIAHELTHAIWSLPDLYDVDNSSAGIGYFGLMGGGSWGEKAGEEPGNTPTHMCAWSKLQQGWITPSTVNVSTNNIQMNASHMTNFNIVKVPTDDPLEYFLVENRSASGYDAGLYVLDMATFFGGIAIWHIDEGQRTLNNQDNADETHKLVDLEEANNAGMDFGIHSGTRTNLFYLGNSTLFDNSSSPDSKKYDGSATNISVNNISTQGTIVNEYLMYMDIEK